MFHANFSLALRLETAVAEHQFQKPHAKKFSEGVGYTPQIVVGLIELDGVHRSEPIQHHHDLGHERAPKTRTACYSQEIPGSSQISSNPPPPAFSFSFREAAKGPNGAQLRNGLHEPHNHRSVTGSVKFDIMINDSICRHVKAVRSSFIKKQNVHSAYGARTGTDEGRRQAAELVVNTVTIDKLRSQHTIFG
ncbi:rh210 [macacine betaherpesvirus 3]|uniref:Rh210 n=1 Tax=Rhesus cytomegalovirus (strain 68-1) TaxID=47929 RepID=Q7TFD3_RHCM6|nr:rh210 [macacine betaherpesvirus 3]AAP50731.1 rh210 [macacine betaherpesvirus 3]AAZ80728.1 rh210 [macacine betaherpesvirus 3]